LVINCLAYLLLAGLLDESPLFLVQSWDTSHSADSHRICLRWSHFVIDMGGGREGGFLDGAMLILFFMVDAPVSEPPNHVYIVTK
jgi:hypothetical protein